MDFDDYEPNKADDRRLKEELRRHDYDHALSFGLGYSGLELDDERARDWTCVAAFQSGQDWALRDRMSRPQPTLKRRFARWIKQQILARIG
jgi:hypothetical protein